MITSTTSLVLGDTVHTFHGPAAGWSARFDTLTDSWSIEVPADAMAEHITVDGASYRITGVVLGSHGHPTIVGLIRQTKTGRDYARGGERTIDVAHDARRSSVDPVVMDVIEYADALVARLTGEAVPTVRELDEAPEAPVTTPDEAQSGAGWFVAVQAENGGEVRVIADGMDEADAYALALTTRRACLATGAVDTYAWNVPTRSILAVLDRVADEALGHADEAHRRDCTEDCTEDCREAWMGAERAIDRASDARQTLTLTLSGDFYVRA